MNININNTIITTNIDEIDFEKLCVGQQIFLLNDKISDFNSIQYNDLIAYYLKNKTFSNLYLFDIIKSNFDIGQNSYGESDMECNTRKEEISFLKINNNLLEIDSIDDFYDIDDSSESEQDMFKEFKNIGISNQVCDKEMVQSSIQYNYNRLMAIKQKEVKKYKTEYYCNVNLDDCVLSIYTSFEFVPEIYSLDKKITLLLFDKEFEKFSYIRFKNNNELLNVIKTEFNPELSNNCINQLKSYHYNLKNLRYNENSKNTFIKTFKDIDFGEYTIESIVDKLISPINEDKELNIQAYLENCNLYFSPTLSYNYSYSLVSEEKVAMFKQKSKAIFSYKIYSSYIDVYTGEILSNNTTKIYQDAQFLHIRVNGHDELYEKIDGIYCNITKQYDKENIKKEISERIKLGEILSK